MFRIQKKYVCVPKSNSGTNLEALPLNVPEFIWERFPNLGTFLNLEMTRTDMYHNHVGLL
jgi:hypothetical protein